MTANPVRSIILCAALLAASSCSKTTARSPTLQAILSTDSLSLAQGTSSLLTLSFTASSTLSGVVQLTFSDLPDGVTLTPTSATLAATTQSIPVSCSVASGAPAGTYQTTITASLDGVQASATLALTITAVQGTLVVSVLGPLDIAVNPYVQVIDATHQTIATIKTYEASTLTNLAPGTYTVTAITETYMGIEYKPTVTGSPVSVQAGQIARTAVNYGAVVGSLAVTVTGPAGITPSVSITAPTSNVIQTVNLLGETTIQNLPPGVYGVTAASVGAAGLRYDPASLAPDDVAITADATTAVTVAYTQGPTLLASTTQLVFEPGAAEQEIQVTEDSYTGSFMESDTCAGVATVTAPSAGTFGVSPLAPGDCAVTITDTFLQTVTINVQSLGAIAVTGTQVDTPSIGGLMTDPNYNQQTLYFFATGAVGGFTATEADLQGALKASLDPGSCGSGESAVATVSTSDGASFSVTAGQPGICQVTLSDSLGQSRIIWISVTTASFTVSNVSLGASTIVSTITAVNGGAGLQGSSSISATGCAAIQGGSSCSGPVPAPIGSTTYAFTAQSSQGDSLGTVNASVTNVQGVANVHSVTLAGVVATVVITPPDMNANTPLTAASVVITANDATGTPISGDFNNSVTLTDADATKATSLAVNGGASGASVAIHASTDVVTLGYSGLAIAPFQLAATGTGAWGAF